MVTVNETNREPDVTAGALEAGTFIDAQNNTVSDFSTFESVIFQESEPSPEVGKAWFEKTFVISNTNNIIWDNTPNTGISGLDTQGGYAGVAFDDGTAQFFDSGTGSSEFSVTVSGSRAEQMHIEQEFAVFGDSDANLFYYDLNNQTQEWTTVLGALPLSSAISPNNNIAVIADNTPELFAFDTADGSELWSFAPTNKLVIACGNEYVITLEFGSSPSDVRLLDISDGSEIWKVDRYDDEYAGGVAIDEPNGRAYVSTRQAVYALDLDDGSEIWQNSESSDTVRGGIDAENNIVAYGTDETYVRYGEDGELAWSDSGGDREFTSIEPDKGYLLRAPSNGDSLQTLTLDAQLGYSNIYVSLDGDEWLTEVTI
jgi:outer membrane protein assembly factor BamB